MKLSKLLRNVLFSITTCAVGLGLLAASGQAQNTQSKPVQKENIMTATTATQQKNDANVDKDAIRPFHINIPGEALADLRRRVAATK